MSGFFDDEPAPEPRRRPSSPPSGRSRALVITAIVMIAFFFALSSFTGVWTDRLWFDSVGHGQVFRKIIGTKVLLFVVFGLLFGGFVFANMVAAYRTRPLFRPNSPEQANLDRYRDVVEPLRKWLAFGVSVVLGLFAGGSASGEWRQFLMWRHHKSFGVEDPYFHRDVGFFVFQLPWIHYVVNVAMTATVLGLIAAAVVHYLFGGIRLQAKGDKVSGAAQVQLSVLLGLFVLFKAVDYWLDRFDLTTAQGRRFTGINYTADHAQLPAKNILMFIALICAVLFFANVFRRTWMLPTVGLGLLVLSAILLGVIWPGIVFQFQVKPSEPDKEAPFLQSNITSTRLAYGVDQAVEKGYSAQLTVTKAEQEDDAASIPGIRLIDPSLVNQTFEQLQQQRGYYSVAPVLDVDRYTVNGRSRDIVLGARELDQSGLNSEQRNWANEHTVYTHGYGIIAAYGNNRPASNREPTGDSIGNGQPFWAEKELPSKGVLSQQTGGKYEQRIYFGEESPNYSIVGKAPGGSDIELDIPDSEGSPANTTYDGGDGVGIGGTFNQLMYALKFGDPEILLSSRVNENSKILYERRPVDRLEKVAPWLTVDRDPYPAVVDGRVQWILDGYTMSNKYPNSQRRSFREMTADTLTFNTPYVALPSDQVNYMRNSVKATVDAYTGEVTLYEWDKDPILEAWEGVFPGLVKPRDTIPPSLLDHMRYPEDMFKVQRSILAQYHVTAPQAFYQGTDRWEVPADPADPTETKSQPPYRLSVRMPPEAGETVPKAPRFSLTSVYVPFNRKNLASFIAVDSDAASSDYGKIRILTLQDQVQVQGPSQIANKFGTDAAIQSTLQPLKLNQRIQNGNLLTLPVGGGLLYVQPVYALQTGSTGSFPVLNYVMASFGENAGIGRTLTDALDNLRGTSPQTVSGNGNGKGNGNGNGKGNGGGNNVPQSVITLLDRISAKQDQADQALRAGNLARYGRIQDDIRVLVQRAINAARREGAAVPPTTTPSPSATPSATPTPTGSP